MRAWLRNTLLEKESEVIYDNVSYYTHITVTDFRFIPTKERVISILKPPVSINYTKQSVNPCILTGLYSGF